jgi:hypothetical protein
MAVLTAATGIMLCDSFADVHRVFDLVLDDQIMTHQIPAAGDEVAAALLKQHPWIAEIELPTPPTPEWVASVIAEYGPSLEVVADPDVRWTRRNWHADLLALVPPEKIIAVVGPEKKESLDE